MRYKNTITTCLLAVAVTLSGCGFSKSGVEFTDDITAGIETTQEEEDTGVASGSSENSSTSSSSDSSDSETDSTVYVVYDKSQESVINEAVTPASDDIEIKYVEHPADEVITFSDSGMEARVRLWTGKEEGDIYRSDVWNIHSIVLDLRSSTGVTTDEIIEFENDTASGYLTMGSNTFDSSTTAVVHSLSDLQYFDNLQSITIQSYSVGGRYSLDLTGIEKCENLSYVRVTYLYLSGTDAITNATSLETLRINYCDNMWLPDFSALTNLKVLDFRCTELNSLDELSGLPITTLYLCQDTTSTDDYMFYDYDVLGTLTNLQTLNLSGIDDVLSEDLESLSGLSNLSTVYLVDSLISETETERNKISNMLPNATIYFEL